MEKLFDESFESGTLARRNIWYGYLELYAEGEYGMQIVLDKELNSEICTTIKDNLEEKPMPLPTETNWYFYGSSATQDAISALPSWLERWAESSSPIST